MLRESIRSLEIVVTEEDDSCSCCETDLDAGRLAIEGEAGALFCSLACADRVISYPAEMVSIWEGGQ